MGGDRGYDGGKKITGRKRHIVVDTMGLLLAVAVTAASVDDAEGAKYRDVSRKPLFQVAFGLEAARGPKIYEFVR